MGSQHAGRYLLIISLVASIVFAGTPALVADDVPRTDISGKILDQDGVTPVSDVTIRLESRSSDLFYESKPSGRSGQYRIPNVPDGEYSIVVVTAEGAVELPNRLNIVGGKPSVITVILTPAASRAAGSGAAVPERDRRKAAILIPTIGSIVVAAFAASEFFEKDGDGSPKLP